MDRAARGPPGRTCQRYQALALPHQLAVDVIAIALHLAFSLYSFGSHVQRFEADRAIAARKTVWMTGCRSWYLDDRGIPAAWPWTFDRFRAVMAAPDLAAYELL